MPQHFRRLIPLIALVLAPTLALAYGVAIHGLLPRRTLGSLRAPSGATVAHDTLPGLTDADVAAFRGLLYDRARRLADTSLRAAFLRRYPVPAAFDPRAMREFLMMNGAARVLGVDSFAAVYRTMVPSDRRLDPNPDYLPGRRVALATALELGSIYPDLDRRNQSRFLRDTRGTPLRTASGDSVPFDPMTLNMGKPTGLSSQAHAHYGLNRQPKSDNPDVLKREPWNFAIATNFPGPVETYAPDNAQFYSDLALLAALDGRPGFRTLSAFYAGNVMHYLADVGNAVHTIQVGIYPIFVDATVQSYLRRATSLFGLFGRAPTRNQIGVDIISNLHGLSEELFQYQLTSALGNVERGHADSMPVSMWGAVRALEAGDDSLTRTLADTLRAMSRNARAPDFARVIAHAVIDANYRDGAEVYRVTREIIAPPLRKGRQTVDFDTMPDDQVWRFVKVARGSPSIDAFNAVHARGLARTTTALRLYWIEYARLAAAPPRERSVLMDLLVARLVRERLDYLAAAERRRQVWMAGRQ